MSNEQYISEELAADFRTMHPHPIHRRVAHPHLDPSVVAEPISDQEASAAFRFTIDEVPTSAELDQTS